jgi:polysaccharide biosynthesis protein PslJ
MGGNGYTRWDFNVKAHKDIMIQTSDALQIWVSHLDRRIYALLIGTIIGLSGGLIGLMIAVFGSLITSILIIGGLVGIYILTDIQAALYAIIGTMLLLPFGTFPFKIGFTPTLLDGVIGVFLLIYLLQWMTGKRQTLQLSPPHTLILLYMAWLMLCFALGLRHAWFTMNSIRQFAGTILSIGLVFIIVDLLRDPKILRRLVLIIVLGIGAQALIALVLYILPNPTANSFLNRLGPIGYPMGDVIRYIESRPELAERAIGTWVDPNTLGSVLAISAVIIAPQVFAKKPVLRYRWLTVGTLALVVLVLILTFSRASMLAMAFGFSIIAVVRYRSFIPVLMLGGLLMLFLPQTQDYIGRFVEAFTAQDLATQMRIGEWTDSLKLIQRYPIFGVGFTGTPEIDIYTDVANMYLIMANQIGLVGVAIYLLTISGILAYGVRAWQVAQHDTELASIHLGYHAALITALTNAVADLYFFRLDFQGPITLFWITVALALASSRLTLKQAKNDESMLAKPHKVG